MSPSTTPADARDDRATDRDDAAGRRDDVARDRDDDADRRDDDAAERDEVAGHDVDDISRRVQWIGRQIVDRLARIENATVDPAAWPDLTPAAVAHLEARAAEERRLAGLDRAAVEALLGRLHDELDGIRGDLRDAVDRRAAARDRHHAAGDRRSSGHDREDAAQDRGQAVVEREQVDPRDLPADGAVGPPRAWPATRPSRDQLNTSAERAIAASQQRISDSRERLGGKRGDEPAPPATPSRAPRN